MDGKSIYNYGLQAAGGIAEADKRVFFDCLDAAAVDFVRQTKILTATCSITTVEGQQRYDLPANFIEFYAKDRAGRFVGKYNDGSYDHWPRLTSFEKLFRANYTESRDVPSRFAIVEKEDSEEVVTGTATADGAATGGQCILQDDAAAFKSTAEVRDIIHNVVDDSDGLVLSVTDDTHLVCALFDGTNDAWEDGDAYAIVPGSNRQIYLDAPSKTAGHVLTLPYICMPAPVYSDYGTWRFSPMSCRKIAYEGVWLFNLDYDEKAKLPQYQHLHDQFVDEVLKVNRETAMKRLQGGRYRTRG